MGAKRRALAELQSVIAEFEDDLDNWERIAPRMKGLASASSDGATRRLIPLREILLADDDVRGVPTGYGPELDSLTGVGWPCGQVSGVSAVRKGGKSTFMLGSFRASAAAGRRCVYATFADLAPKPLKRRLLKQACGMGGYPKVQLDRIPDYMDALAELDDPFGPSSKAFVYDGIEQGRDIEGFYNAMIAAHSDQPIEVIFCDYAQRITSKEVGLKHGRTAQLEYVSEQMAELAGKLDCPIILGSQVTKKEDGEYMTKYASGLEEDVGLLLQITRDDHETTAKVKCVLNRFGKQDVTIKMRFNDEKVRFE
jgi:replicative DNA helicase